MRFDAHNTFWSWFCVGLVLTLTWFPTVINAQEKPPSGLNLTVEGVAQQVYGAFPEIPLENQYKRLDTGALDPEHTLISRVIRYHRDVEKRATRYRFDWKITLADYLGVNQDMKADRYPGHSTLTSNPLDKDVEAIRALNRKQRQALVDFLAQIYRPAVEPTKVKIPSKAVPSAPTVQDPNKPVLSKPGDAQLLMP